MTYLTQWLEYCFHTAGVIGSNPIVGRTIRYRSRWYLISFLPHPFLFL